MMPKLRTPLTRSKRRPAASHHLAGNDTPSTPGLAVEIAYVETYYAGHWLAKRPLLALRGIIHGLRDGLAWGAGR